MSNKPKGKPVPRCERKVKLQRVFSANFPENMDKSGIKCWVPWEDYLCLRNKYKKLIARRRREINRSNYV